ncbi:MAG: SUMF1/EgtB/PvdO family nonheme iron enzyme [Phycisphaeraceae bacterium]|nr:SUMF1/EgtB/PvdO family nonheme iron enzyme [Phycisphaeraceae bacterium]
MKIVPYLAVSVIACAAAHATPNTQRLEFSEEYGLPFSRIGAPGNAPTLMRRLGFPQDARLMGAVNHEYRIMTREVTNGEFLEFARAIAPYIDAIGSSGGTIGGDGLLVQRVGNGYSFSIQPGRTADEPIRTTFYAAAMYANWLHNGKGSTIEAFQDGAYDAETFRRFPGQPIPVGQASRNADARFWIPSMDEWVKAGHYDPDRFGEGDSGGESGGGGWWDFPDSSDTQLIPGRPELGGQTNAGSPTEWPSGQERPHEVGLYPDTQSPWGLLDVSGGASEWTESLLGGGNARLAKGTDTRYGGDLFADELVWFGHGSPVQFGGIRLAAVIPAPSGGGIVLVACAVTLTRRRRR